MTPAATERRRFLACLSDPSRFSLVTMLADGPRCVTELASLVGLSQSCTTRHLQALLRESIVVAERRGKRVVYALRREGREVHPVLRWACEAGEGSGPGDGERHAPVRSRRRPVPADPLALEPEPTRTAAVEHESGWVEADVAPLGAEAFITPATAWNGDGAENEPGSGDRTDREDRAPRVSSFQDGPARPRPEMDDFLL